MFFNGEQIFYCQHQLRLQGLDIQGQYASRAQEIGLMDERAQLDANELATSEEQIQAARAARAEAGGQFMGGVGEVAGAYAAGGTGKLAQGMEKLNALT